MDPITKKAFEYDNESSNTAPHEENLAGSPNNPEELHQDDRAQAAGRGSHFGEAFWFDPEGKMFEVKSDHITWANQHKQELQDEYGLNLADPSRLIYEMLDSGWVRAMRTPSELALTVGNLIDTPSIVEEIIDGLYDPSKDVMIGDQTESVRISYPEKSILPQVQRQLNKLVANASEDDRARTWLINTFLDREDKGLEIAELAGWFSKVSPEIGIPDTTMMETYKSMVESGHIFEKDGYAFLKSASGATADPDMYAAAGFDCIESPCTAHNCYKGVHGTPKCGGCNKFQGEVKILMACTGPVGTLCVECLNKLPKTVVADYKETCGACSKDDHAKCWKRMHEDTDMEVVCQCLIDNTGLHGDKKASDATEPSSAEFGAGFQDNPNQLTFWDERGYGEKYPMMAKYPQLVDQIIELIGKWGDNEYKVEQDLFYANNYYMMNLSYSVGSPEGYKLIREVYQWLKDYQKDNGEPYAGIQLKESSIQVEAIVRKTPDKEEWCVYSHKGKSLGCYASQAKAEERLQQVEMFKHMKGSEEISMHKEAQAPVTLHKVEQKGSAYIAEVELPRSATRHHDLRQLNKFLKTWAIDNFASDLEPAIQQSLGIDGPFDFDQDQTEFYPNVTEESVTFDVRFNIASPAPVVEEASEESTTEWRPRPSLAKVKVLVRGKYDERTNDFKVKVGEGPWQRFSSEISVGDRLSRVSDELAAEAFIDEMKMSVGQTVDAVLTKTANDNTTEWEQSRQYLGGPGNPQGPNQVQAEDVRCKMCEENQCELGHEGKCEFDCTCHNKKEAGNPEKGDGYMFNMTDQAADESGIYNHPVVGESDKKAYGGAVEVQIEDDEGNEKTINVEYDYTRGSAGNTSGGPDSWSPPDPSEIYVTEMFWVDGEKQLTKEESKKVMDRWGDYIYEKIDDYENDRDAEGALKEAAPYGSELFGVIERGLKEAEEYFSQAKVVPDKEDLIGYLVEYIGDTTGFALTSEDIEEMYDGWLEWKTKKGSTVTADAWETCDNCGGDGQIDGQMCPACEGAGKFLVRKAEEEISIAERYDNRKRMLLQRLNESQDPVTRIETKEALESLEEWFKRFQEGTPSDKKADERPPQPAKETAGPGMKWVYRETDGQWTQVPETDDQNIVPVQTQAYETVEMEEELRNYIRETARPNKVPQFEARRVTEMIYDSFHGEDMLDYISNSIGNEYDLRLYVEDVLTDEEGEGSEVQSMAGRDCPQCGTHLEKENPNDPWKCNCGWSAE